MAPVRETVSQTLASLLIHMPHRSLTHVHSILLQMIQQNFTVPVKSTRSRFDEKTHIWEVRHAGLLGIKYEVAVRSDLFEEITTRSEGDESGKEILRGVVDAAILGYVCFISFFSHCHRLIHNSSLGDPDDDVRSVAASCLLPIASHLVEQLPESLNHVLLVLWRCLRNMKDDLSSSVGAVMDLLGEFLDSK